MLCVREIRFLLNIKEKEKKGIWGWVDGWVCGWLGVVVCVCVCVRV